ncbi:MAG: hypothetical protein ACYCT7_03405 [bacterium]
MATGENIKENAIRKVIQELIVPNLSKIINKQDILEEKINSTNTRIDAMDIKIDSLKNEFKADLALLDGKIDSLDEKMDIKIDAISEKMDIKIDALSEKVDYMNKTNERLFDIIFHSTGKENNRPK